MILYKKYNSLWDKVCIITSVGCIIHCVLFPILISFLPILTNNSFENDSIEYASLAIVVIIGGYAIMKNYVQYRKNFYLPLGFILSIISLAAGNAIENSVGEIMLKFFGSTSLIMVHIYNWRMHKNCKQQK